MRVGITTDFRYSAFSSGHANTSLSLVNVFQAMGCNVVLLHTQNTDDVWWDDVKEMKEKIPRLSIEECLKTDMLDILIESSFFVPPLTRRRLAKYCVWYNRKPGLFTDLEATVYGCKPDGRNLEGLSAIWTADIFTTPDDIVYYQTLYPTIPIYTVPWIWTPEIIETHRRTTQSPVWLQSYEATQVTVPWSIHIAESNASSTSSCTLPLVIMRHSCITDRLPISRVTVHNTELLHANVFFKENIVKHCSVTDLSYNMIGRQRIIDWVHDQHSILLSHNRFVSLKMANLEAIWVGIPLVHNSEILRDLGNGLEKLYFSKNSVTGAAAALKTIIHDTSTIPYLSNIDALTNIRKGIINKFYPHIQIQGWAQAVEKTMSTSVVHVEPKYKTKNNTFDILFTDMWDQFNETHNMFTLALENALHSKGITVSGHSISTLPSDVRPDLVLFGPFGETWKTLSADWPKVHFTGENTEPINNPSVKLNIGYKLPEISDNTYLRMPLWQFEIDWFGADLTQIRNPLPLPIDSCTTVQNDYSKREKFCAFVVTNPKNPVRNEAFTTLNSYKPVSSAGRLYNNVGDTIFAGLGGGGGELKKHTFLKDYRFCIAYENEAAPGYTTEKLLHAKAAGCIPIYWGDSKVGRDFDSKGFLNANECQTPSDLVALVDSVERDPNAWAAIASVPALSIYTRDLVRRNFAEMVRRFLLIAGRNELVPGLPSLLGAKTSAEASILRNKNDIGQSTDNLFFVTGATLRFWSIVDVWATYIEKYKVAKSIKARVYVGADVSESALSETANKFKTVEFVRFPSETPTEFSDFWDPQHYAWKLWIYNTVVNDATVKGSLVFYMDVATCLLRLPTEWLQQATETGVSFLDDCRQTNRSWCHAKFCDALKVTETEKNSQQIAACLLLFVAGHPSATKLFGDAYALGQIRDIVTGEKWLGSGPTRQSLGGPPFGHRHDQSILSILSQRQGCSRYPIDKVYGDKSARTTFKAGQAVYVHRGNFKSYLPIVPGIDDAIVINLDRREDRLKSFHECHPDLIEYARRLSAYDGRTLTLTPALARLFSKNDFMWKKGVMGCALSHLKAWTGLLDEPPNINTILILEDDARLKSGWREAWASAYPNLPNDWDCVYLGGILPPNKLAFANTLERVAPGLARIKPNQIFGQKDPTRYFHFCAYAYVLSRRGAAKILKTITDRDGYWTSADHMVCNCIDTMNLYVLDPLMAGVSQDNDPIYQKAEFNNFNRVDTFDSDLWNNDERFTPDEIKTNLSKEVPLNIAAAFIVERPQKKRFIALNTCKINTSTLHESKWLQDLFQSIPFFIESVSKSDTFDRTDELIVVVSKPNWLEQLEWLEVLRVSHTFKILHLSDEFGTDPIHMYSWPEVTGVLRFYRRPGLDDPKIHILPLGYHWQFKGNRDMPHLCSPNLPFRENVWSFAGTDWFNRSKDLEVLHVNQPHYLKYYADWNDPAQLKDEEYISLLLNTKFVPCPRGQNVETYRFYEALECGCIPLFIDTPETTEWLKLFNNEIPFLKIPNWEYAARLLQFFQENSEQMEQCRTMILVAWAKYKSELKTRVRDWISCGKN